MFVYIVQKFPKLSFNKIKEGIFVGPQIRELLLDGDFERTMSRLELAAWRSFKQVCTGFLGKHRDIKYREQVGQLLHLTGDGL